MRVLVVGAGHNGLVCACYLARAGLDVLVLEQAGRPGGGARTDELVPGFRFNTHSAAHNIIRMTPVLRELELEAAGLEYLEMDPFAVAVHADGRIVRFHRDVEATVASIAEHDEAEARAYAAFMADAVPLVDLGVQGLAAGGDVRRTAGRVLRRLPAAGALAARAGGSLAGELLGSYGGLLRTRLPSDLTRAPVAAFAAHANAGPDVPGGAIFGFWQAAYHRFGQWQARGGAQGLTDALVRRLDASGGALRCGARVVRVDARGGRVRGVELADGELLRADAVVTAVDVKAALLELLDPPLGGRAGTALAAASRSNTVQALVHVAADRLPAYPGGRPGDWHGLQSYVDGLDALSEAFRAAEDRRLVLPAPSYAFTPTALDPSLAPPGGHALYLAAPAVPFDLRGGWTAAADALAEDLLDQVEARAPGFRAGVREVVVRTPEQMAEELAWPGAHPMHLDVTPGQLGPLRPVAALAGHRTPVRGLYASGAGTAPTGGIAGAPGRAAARALLRDAGRG